MLTGDMLRTKARAEKVSNLYTILNKYTKTQQMKAEPSQLIP